MAKFRVLDRIRIVLTRLGMYPQSVSGPKPDIVKTLTGYHIIFIICAMFITSSSLFVYQNISQFELALETSLIVIAGFQIGGMLLSVRTHMKEIEELHFILQDVVDKNPEGEVSEIYAACEQKAQTTQKWIYIYLLSELTVYSMCLINSLYCIFTGNFDTSTWTSTYNLVIPFNEDAIWRWYLMLFTRFNMGMTYTACTTSITSYFVACCLYIYSMCEHFAVMMRSISEDVRQIQEEEDGSQKHLRLTLKFKEKLSQAIDIHVKIFSIFKTVGDINSGAIFSLLPLNAVFFAMSLYNMENSPFDLVSMGFRYLCILCSLIWPSMYCFYASNTTDRIALIGNDVYDLNWYDYPSNVRKFMILIIVRSQRPMYLSGYHLINCTLETFGKLFKSSCSYYIIFRSISQH